MKIVVLLIALMATAIAKDTKVRGHTKKDGSYVEPHIRKSPNKTETDNYGTRGNTNPQTGKQGKKTPKK